MTRDQAQQPIVAPFALKDAPTFTGPLLRPSGHLAIVVRGHGLIVGPLGPDELRSFAGLALTIAAQLEEQADQAAATAADQLAALVAGGGGDA